VNSATARRQYAVAPQLVDNQPGRFDPTDIKENENGPHRCGRFSLAVIAGR